MNMSSSIENLQYHLVFSTKYRYNLITSEIANYLKDFLFKKQESYKFKIESLAIESNHVHLLINIPSSTIDLNEIIRKIKGGSSLSLRKKFKHLSKLPSLWTPSHFIATVGNVSQTTIDDYINSQGIEEKEIITRTFKYKVLSPTNYKINQLKIYFDECVNSTRNIVSSAIFQDFERIKRKENEFGLYLRGQCIDVIPSKSKSANYWLKIPGSRLTKPIYLGLLGRPLPENFTLKDSTIRQGDRKKHKKIVGKDFFVYLSIEEERIIKKPDLKNAISIDLGINHPITSVTLLDGKINKVNFYGKDIKDQVYKRSKRHAQLHHSGIINPNSKHTNRINDMIHNYTTKIVKEAVEKKCCIIVGNLLGLINRYQKKLRKTNKKSRKMMASMQYAKISQQLQYKATLANVAIIFVDESYTSQQCNHCGIIAKSNRKKQRYECHQCGYKTQAYLNGALNIYQRSTDLLSRSHPTLRDEKSSECNFVNAGPRL